MLESPGETSAFTSSLPFWMVFVPMLMAVPVYLLTSRSARLGGYLAVLTGFLSVGLGLVLLPQVALGVSEMKLGVMGYGMVFRVDAFGAGIALFAALGWSLAMVFSLDYMGHGHKLPRYWAFMIFTMGATLGVFVSGDLFTLFVFFEVMTFASYALVVHEETPEAMAAGKTFIYMGALGGLCLLFAVMALNYVAGTDVHVSLIERVVPSGYFILVTLMALVGFGMKAGMVPLHIWLPQAHPVAPAPASAVLSGVLIKAGAYGLIRVFLMILGPDGHGHWAEVFNNGMMLLGIGLTTMVLGGFMALFQVNAKRILAYSSISQMGYILTGIGSAAVLGMEGPMGFGGAFYHMMNHVVFKAAAFLAVGYVYMKTHQLDITKVSGLWRQMPLAALAFLAAFGAITGLPGFSGFASKIMIHHALVEAYHETHLVSLLWAERAFVVGSALTAVYFLRLAGLFFGRKRLGHMEESSFPWANAALLVLALLIVLVGIFPDFLLQVAVFPAVDRFNYDAYAVKYLHKLEFFLWYDIKDVLVSFFLGLSIYLVGSRFGLFKAKLPSFLSVEGLVYKPLCKGCYTATVTAGQVDTLANQVYSRLSDISKSLTAGAVEVDRGINESYHVAGRVSSGIVNKTEGLDHKLNESYDESGRVVMGLVNGAERLDKSVDGTYVNVARRAKEAVTRLDDEAQAKQNSRSLWSPSNLNLCILVLALTLTLLAAVFILLGIIR